MPVTPPRVGTIRTGPKPMSGRWRWGSRWRAALLAAAMAAGVVALGPPTAQAGATAGTVGDVRLSSDAAGELTISWDPPASTPSDYRVMWAEASQDYLSWKADNEATRGNSYPSGTATSLTLTGLTEGAEYKVRMRARYSGGSSGSWSGPWSDTVIAVAGDGDSRDEGDDAEDERSGEDDAEGEGSGEDEDVSEPGVGFDAVMGVGTWSYGGGAAYGYKFWGGVAGSFEIGDGAQDWMVGGRGHVRGVSRMPGERVLPVVGAVSDSVVLVHVHAIDSPFVLTVGGRLFASTRAVVPSGSPSPAAHFWVWDSQCARWSTGDQVAVALETVPDDDPRLAARNDATLATLSLAGAVLDQRFDPATPDYTAGAAAGAEQVTIGVAAADANVCSVEVVPADADPDADGHQIDLGDDGAVITVSVTAADNATVQEYSVTVGRDGVLPAAAARLSLDGVGGVGFDPAKRRYHTDTPDGKASTRVSVSGAGGATTRTFSLRAGDQRMHQAGSDGQVALSARGDTLVAVRVSAPGNERQSIYTVRLRPPSQQTARTAQRSVATLRTGAVLVANSAAGMAPAVRPRTGVAPATKSAAGAAPWAAPRTVQDSDVDPRLSALGVSPGTLSPVFAAATFEYAVSVAHDAAHLTVSPTAVSGATAMVAAPDADADTAGHQVALNAAQPGKRSAQTAFLIAVTAGTKIESYTVTVTRAAPPSTDATLSTLTLSAGTLAPAFAPDVDSYTAAVANSTAQVTVTATANDTGAAAAITPADADGDTDGHQIDLDAGANQITVTVTAADNTTTSTYQITVTRDAPSDATLASLSLSHSTLSPTFASGTHLYTTEVGPFVDQITVTAAANLPDAHLIVSPPDADPHTAGHQIDITAPHPLGPAATTTVAVAVTAPNGTNRSTYAVAITRPPHPPVPAITFELPEHCTLHHLGEGNWTPRRDWDDNYRGDDDFCPQTHGGRTNRYAAYYLLLVRETGEVTIKTDNYPRSVLVVISANGNVIASDKKAYDIDRGPPYQPSLTLTLDRGAYVVEAGNRITTRCCEGDHHRLGYWGAHIVRSSGYQLDGLAISGVDMTGFDPEATDYARTITADTSTVTVTPTVSQPDAIVVISPPDAVPGTDGHQVALEADGLTEIAVAASHPQLLGASRVYKVAITHPTPSNIVTAPDTGGGMPPGTQDSDVDPQLSALSVSPGTLSPVFAAATFEYAVPVAHDVAQLTVSPTAVSGASALVAAPDADTDTAGHQVALNAAQPGNRSAQTAFLVAATAGSKIESYAVTVTRAASPMTDATLSALTLSAGTLAPAFAAHADSYTAAVANATTQITVTATANDTSAAAAIAPADADGSTDGHQVDLAAGVNEITVSVTSGDSATTKTYRVAVTRDAPSDATLATLSLSEGALSPAFAAGTNAYTTEVDTYTEQITVSVTATDADAQVVISPPDADPGAAGHQIGIAAPHPLGPAATTTATIAVTSENGTARSTYAVTISRPPPPLMPAISVELPGHCTLRDLGEGDWTPWRKWDSNWGPDGAAVDYCGMLQRSWDDNSSEYYQLLIHRAGEVTIRTDNYPSAYLYVMSANGDLVASDTDAVLTNKLYKPSLTLTLDRGAYVIEVGNRLGKGPHHPDRHRVGYWGDHIVRSTEYRLDDLAVSGVELIAFDRDVTDYTRHVAADVTTVTITPTPSRADAHVVISPQDADTGTAGHQVNLEADGETEITVSASPPEMIGTWRTYRVKIIAVPDTTSPLVVNDATLSALSLAPINFGTFSRTRLHYTYTAGFGLRVDGVAATLAVTTNHSGATWTASRPDADPDTEGHQIFFDGDESVAVTVTSQDGLRSNTYTIDPPAGSPFSVASTEGCGLCAPGSIPGEIVSLWHGDGKFMTAGVKTATVSIWNARTGALEESFTPAAPAGASGAVRASWTDGETLWVAFLNHGAGKEIRIYPYSLTTKQLIADRSIHVSTRPSNPDHWWADRRPSGIWSDGKTMYVLTNYGYDLKSYDLATGAHLKTVRLQSWPRPGGGAKMDALFVSSSIWNVAWPMGMWSDGKTVWIAPYWGATRAYDLHTGEHRRGLDLDHRALSGRQRHGGLWSDGHTMWMTDVDNGALYPYTMPENARLKSLSVSDGDIGVFSNGIFEYAVEVPSGTTTTTVTAQQAFAGGSASVTYSTTDADTNTDGHQVTLTAGQDNVVTVSVTAPNGTDTETYTLTITHTTG